jgi:hypothetical protein
MELIEERVGGRVHPDFATVLAIHPWVLPNIPLYAILLVGDVR